ncbi:MAG TPA: hypothetical protein VN622_16180 [Clostridia bacterium]|nr:hypothetical protein [Clostridia bacterium]
MRKFFVLLGLVAVFALPARLMAQQKVTVVIDPDSAGIRVPDDFVGLSFESAAILPDSKGQYPYFRSDNRSLIQLFKSLGIKNLRIGGNTSDRPSVKVPSEADINALFGFARLAGTKVIYSLRMRESNPPDVVRTAKFLMDRYKAETHCLTVGNEPNVYKKEYPAYRDDLKKFMDAINAVAPDARFCGPATTPGAGGWAANFAADFGPSGKILEVTQHSYPGGSGRKVIDADAGRKQMLSAEFTKEYEKLYRAFVPAAQKNELPYRIEETNNFFSGGTKDVSNTFASALWALDYLYWWAEHDAAGINFHTGDNVAAGEEQAPCWYAAFWSTPNGYDIHPLSYALKAFDVGSHGRLLRPRISPEARNLSVHAVLGADKAIYITLINKGIDESSAVDVSIDAGRVLHQPAVMFLSVPKSNIAATSGITLGDESISSDGNWTGKWRPLKGNAKRLTVELPPASVAIVRVQPR